MSTVRKVAIAVAATLTLAGTAQAASVYTNPFRGDTVRAGRVDMGVDLCLRPGQPIRAIGSAVIMGHLHNWYRGQPFIWYRLTSGPHAGRYVYVAEQIYALAPVGRHVAKGAVIARYARRGTCIETGWATRHGWTLAQATSGYREGWHTRAGYSFRRFLRSLGVRV